MSAERLRSPAVLWTAGWLALAVVLWLAAMGAGISALDEAWLVQVLDRVGSGDALYDDVFFGVTPLAVWAGLPLTAVFGAQVAVVKALGAAIAAATALLAAAVAGRLGAGLGPRIAVGIACVAYLTLPGGSIYNPLANLAALACLGLLAAWRETGPVPSARLLAAAGAMIGLAAAAKHTTGGLAGIAMVAVVVFASPRPAGLVRERLRDALLATAVALAVFAVAMAPVAIAGDLGSFRAYALEKGAFVSAGSVSYLDTLRGLLDLLADPGEQTRTLLVSLGALIPPLACIAVAANAVVDRGRAVLVGCFTAAAIATIFPRADLPHIVSAIPMCGVAIAAATAVHRGRVGPAWRPAAAVAVLVLLSATAAWNLAARPVRGIEAGYELSATSHFEGALVDAQTQDASDAIAAGLREADGGEGRTLLLSPAAGYLYLAAGIESPTRHDYPLVTAFRGDDVAGLLADIDNGEIERVCVDETTLPELAPDELIAGVRERLEPVGFVGGAAPFGCELYER